MYPTRFFVAYPLAFVGGLIGIYGLRAEVDFGVGVGIGAALVGTAGFVAGWSIARSAHRREGDEHHGSGAAPLIAGMIAIPAYFVAKVAIGPRPVLWFCALAFVFLAGGFFIGALATRRGSEAHDERTTSE